MDHDSDEGFSNVSRILSSMPGNDPVHYEIFDACRNLRDLPKQGKITTHLLIKVLEAFKADLISTCEDETYGQDSELMEDTLYGNEVIRPSGSEVLGLFGQPVQLKESKKESSPSKAEVVCIDTKPHNWSNQDKIMSDVQTCFNSIDPQLRELETLTQCPGKEEILSSQPENNISQRILNLLKNIRGDLLKSCKYARRYEDLAFAGLSEKFNFTFLYKCFTRFFKCLKAMHPKGGSNSVSKFLVDTLEGAWILDSGDQLTKKVDKKSPKHFIITLRLLGCVSGVSMKGEPQLKMMTADTRKEVQQVTCKKDFNGAENILTISNINITNPREKDGNLMNYERLYILTGTQKCTFLGHDINLKYETCPFTLYTSANQYHASIFTVKWYIFSQEESESKGYMLKKILPHESVLQMLNLLAKNNTPTDGKSLDQHERSALSRLLKRQNSDDRFVSMASIGHDKMWHPREEPKSSQDFSFYTWYQACLNTLAFFNERWDRRLMLGFYSKEDANALLKESGKSGDTVIRLSETRVSSPEAVCPKARITFHIAIGPKHEPFIDNLKVSDDLDLSYEIGRVELYGATLCQYFLPTKLAFCMLFPSFSLIRVNGYYKQTKNRVEPVPQNIDEYLKRLTLKDTPPPSSASLLEADTSPGHPVKEVNVNEQASVMLAHKPQKMKFCVMEEQEGDYGEPEPKIAHQDTKSQFLTSQTDPWPSSPSSNFPPDLKAVNPSLSPIHPNDMDWLCKTLSSPPHKDNFP